MAHLHNNIEATTFLDSYSCFSSNFVTEDSTVTSDFATRIHGFQCIQHKLAQIQLAKAPDSDGIHPYTLKMCAANLCKPLCYLSSLLLLAHYTKASLLTMHPNP